MGWEGTWDGGMGRDHGMGRDLGRGGTWDGKGPGMEGGTRDGEGPRIGRDLGWGGTWDGGMGTWDGGRGRELLLEPSQLSNLLIRIINGGALINGGTLINGGGTYKTRHEHEKSMVCTAKHITACHIPCELCSVAPCELCSVVH